MTTSAQQSTVSLHLKNNDLSPKLSTSIALSSGKPVNVKNLHPQGLYIGGIKQRKVQKNMTQDDLLRSQASSKSRESNQISAISNNQGDEVLN